MKSFVSGQHRLSYLVALGISMILTACGGGGGDVDDAPTNPPPPMGTPIADTRSTAAGWRHSIFLKSDGTVWTLGDNEFGQLGDGSYTSRTEPVPVAGLTNVTSVAAGDSFSLALRSDGSVWAWGVNDEAELGDGSTTNRNVPVRVKGISGQIKAIVAGSYHALALGNDGTLWAWGRNTSGPVGDGTTVNRMIAVKVPGMTGVARMAAGGFHSVASKADGSLWAWGRNHYGQLGDGTYVDRHSPVRLMPQMVRDVAAGCCHSMALSGSDGIHTWGNNTFGQLGTANPVNRTRPLRVLFVPPHPNVKQIYAGGDASFALLSDGGVLAWGDNRGGMIGNGTFESSHNPTKVLGLQAVGLSAGIGHVLAVDGDGRGWAWGGNSNGRLGDGTTTNQAHPVHVMDALQVPLLYHGGR